MSYEPVIYTPVYNDAEALAKSAEKMKDYPLKRIVVDGRYHGFKRINDSDISTDDILEVCKQYGFGYYICTPCYEEQKFNHALNILSHDGHKVMLLLSADEWVKYMPVALTWIKGMCTGCEYPMMFQVQIQELRPGHLYEQGSPFLPKVFYYLDKLENKNNHWATYVRGTHRLMRSFPTNVPSMLLYHDNKLRSDERDQIMVDYQHTNIERERDDSFAVRRDRHYGG